MTGLDLAVAEELSSSFEPRLNILTSEIVEVLCYKVPHAQLYSTCNALPLFASVKETVYPL